jgi:hypothetical protein
MRYLVRLLAVVLVLALPAPASAWSFEGHRLIMRRALDLLPPELQPFFNRHREEIVVRVIDPDLWRTAGWPEDPHHFFDFGVREYGKFPFDEVPRAYDQALEKFGRTTLERNGLLPWRLAEVFGHLRRGFDGFSRQSTYSTYDTILFSAAISHYVQDAHQPLHAADNYDGQLTGQRGLHSRFEDQLIERFQSRLKIVPAAPRPITAPRDAAFEILLDSYQHVDQLLEADQLASAGKETYDNDYFEKLFVRVQPLLERQLSRAVTATASIIIGAWDAAGRPTPQLEITRAPQKVSR